jgi:hypothetical protein
MKKIILLDRISNVNRMYSVLTILMWVSFLFGLMVLCWFMPLFPNGNYDGKADAYIFIAVSKNPKKFLVIALLFELIFIASLLYRKRMKKKYKDFIL